MNEERFWDSALSRWIRNNIAGPNAVVKETEWRCSQHQMRSHVRFSELCNGHALNLLFSVVEPESLDRSLLQKSQTLDFKPDLAHKIRTFYQLLRNLTTFYQTHSLYPVLLPDVLRIVEEPIPEKSGHEMHKIFGLLLGAVVHADHKSELIDRLQCISREDETQIVAELAKITGNKDFLINLKLDSDILGTLDDSENTRRLLETLINERDSYALKLLKMAEELESDEASSTTISSDAGMAEDGEASSKVDQIQLLREKNESLEKKLILKYNEIKIANDAAQEYENELNELRNDFNKQNKRLKEASDRNLELTKELRHQKDEIDQLVFDCQKLRDAETDRKTLLNEKERWSAVKEENEKLKKRLESFEKSIPLLRAESSVCNEFRTKNEALNLELRQLRNNLNSTQTQFEEASSRAQKLTEENEHLLHELKQASFSLTDKTNCSLADFSADLSLEDQLNKSTIAELEQKVHDMQIELARAAQPEELQRLSKEHADLQRRFTEFLKEKTAVEARLNEKNAELQSLSDQFKQAEQARAKLKSQLADLSALKTQLQQQEVLQRQKDLLTNKLKNAEQTLSAQTKKTKEKTIECQKLEAELQQQQRQLKSEGEELEELRAQVRISRSEHDGCSRLRKSLEAECTSLRQRVETLEEELGRKKLNLQSSDAIRKRLNITEQSLLQKESVISELETDNQAMKQQIELTNATVQKLREELLTERNRLSDLLSRLRSICTTCRLKSADSDQRLNNDELLKDDKMMIDTIEMLLLAAFTAARSEADSLRVERQMQLEEINVLRRNIEDLKQTHSQFDLNGDVAQDKLRVQMSVLQERLNAALARENELAAEVQASKRTVEDLQRQLQQKMKTSGELSRLRINQRDFEQEMQSLKETVAQTTEKLHLTEKQRYDLNNKLIRQQNTHQAQQNEIERLINLNDSLAVDFDRCRFENNELKRKLDLVNETNRTATSRQAELKSLEQNMRQARDTLKSEQDRLASCEQNLARVTRELNETRRDYAALLRQKDTASEELAQLCDVNSAQKSSITNLNLTVQQLNSVLADKDNELATFRKEIETLREYNSDENKLLVRQIEMLMRQNQDLHKRSDTFYVEQKDLQEKLLEVRRHKENLEQKLAEHYKQNVDVVCKAPEKITFVKRAAKALHLKSPSRKPPTTRLHEKASGSEDSSIYSADEGFLPSPPQQAVDAQRNDNLLVAKPTTGFHSAAVCSSSDRGSGSSPDYDQIHFSVHHFKKNSVDSQQSSNCASTETTGSFRSRNTRIGGSLRCPPSFRPNAGNWRIPTSIEEDLLSLNGSERSIDASAAVKPNGSRSNWTARNSKLPPPYVPKQNSRPPPPAYPPTTSRICSTPPIKFGDFFPINTSTPNSEQSSAVGGTTLAAKMLKESEQRPVQLDPIERQAKGHSFYDNYNASSSQLLIENLETKSKKSANNNDLWVGFGCV